VLADDPKNLRAMAWLAETIWREGDVAGARAELATRPGRKIGGLGT
jgi:hypothetical protein